MEKNTVHIESINICINQFRRFETIVHLINLHQLIDDTECFFEQEDGKNRFESKDDLMEYVYKKIGQTAIDRELNDCREINIRVSENYLVIFLTEFTDIGRCNVRFSHLHKIDE